MQEGAAAVMGRKMRVLTVLLALVISAGAGAEILQQRVENVVRVALVKTQENPNDPAYLDAARRAYALTDLQLKYEDGADLLDVQVSGSPLFNFYPLDDNKRWVVDLYDTVNLQSGKALTSTSKGKGIVNQVRTSLFALDPQFVSRIVFDLSKPGDLRVSTNSAGLMIRIQSGDASTSLSGRLAAAVAHLDRFDRELQAQRLTFNEWQRRALIDTPEASQSQLSGYLNAFDDYLARSMTQAEAKVSELRQQAASARSNEGNSLRVEVETLEKAVYEMQKTNDWYFKRFAEQLTAVRGHFANGNPATLQLAALAKPEQTYVAATQFVPEPVAPPVEIPPPLVVKAPEPEPAPAPPAEILPPKEMTAPPVVVSVPRETEPVEPPPPVIPVVEEEKAAMPAAPAPAPSVAAQPAPITGELPLPPDARQETIEILETFEAQRRQLESMSEEEKARLRGDAADAPMTPIAVFPPAPSSETEPAPIEIPVSTVEEVKDDHEREMTETRVETVETVPAPFTDAPPLQPIATLPPVKEEPAPPVGEPVVKIETPAPVEAKTMPVEEARDVVEVVEEPAPPAPPATKVEIPSGPIIEAKEEADEGTAMPVVEANEDGPAAADAAIEETLPASDTPAASDAPQFNSMEELFQKLQTKTPER